MSSAPSIPKAFTIPVLIVIILAGVYQAEIQGTIPEILPTKLPSIGSSVTADQPTYKVLRVTDGDTLHLDINGVNETVRLIGINTPETVDPRKPVQCFGKEASNRMKELVDGQMVRIELDDSQSTRDIYGRLLAYVYLEDGQMVNRKMIADGYAYEYTYLTPYKYQKEFRELQTLARTTARGLWGPDTCNGKK
jgi:micrococcal nuclease